MTMTEDMKKALPALAGPNVVPGFQTRDAFELIQRQCNALASSTMVPAQYRDTIVVNKERGETKKNPHAMGNCLVALNLAHRLNADPLMVMQNLHVINGRPSWSAVYIIAALNAAGRYTSLRFDITPPEPEQAVEGYDFDKKQWVQVKIRNQTCRAWAIERSTNQRLESPPVSLELAVREGWYMRSGSKWKTMPEVMLRYRAASFFGKLYAPELLMGLQSTEELLDTLEAKPEEEGKWSVPSATDVAAEQWLPKPSETGALPKRPDDYSVAHSATHAPRTEGSPADADSAETHEVVLHGDAHRDAASNTAASGFDQGPTLQDVRKALRDNRWDDAKLLSAELTGEDADLARDLIRSVQQQNRAASAPKNDAPAATGGRLSGTTRARTRL